MYIVTVLTTDGEAIDTRSFNYGSFHEIGYWLDNYGYNDERYELRIRMTER